MERRSSAKLTSVSSNGDSSTSIFMVESSPHTAINSLPRLKRKISKTESKKVTKSKIKQEKPSLPKPGRRSTLLKQEKPSLSKPGRRSTLLKQETTSPKKLIRRSIQIKPINDCTAIDEKSCALVHRESEYRSIFDFVNGRLENHSSGCLYIAGIPGAGKTATVLRVMERLKNNKKIINIFINGLDYTNSKQVLGEIASKVSQKKITIPNALSYLETYFSNKKNASIILIIDEFDHLCQNNQYVWYNICEWTTRKESKLIFITIANTMDLPERVFSKQISSRFGYERISFSPYSFEQLADIIKQNIDHGFDSDAINLICRKTASIFGDVRRCISYCRAASDIAKSENPDAEIVNVSVKHVELVFQNDLKEKLLNSLNLFSKILLMCITRLQQNKEETTFQEAYPLFISSCKSEDSPPDTSGILRILTNLSVIGLINISSPITINSKIKINVPSETIFRALKDI